MYTPTSMIRPNMAIHNASGYLLAGFVLTAAAASWICSWSHSCTAGPSESRRLIRDPIEPRWRKLVRSSTRNPWRAIAAADSGATSILYRGSRWGGSSTCEPDGDGRDPATSPPSVPPLIFLRPDRRWQRRRFGLQPSRGRGVWRRGTRDAGRILEPRPIF